MNELQFRVLCGQTRFDGDCLLWTGLVSARGYGRYLGRPVHVLFYEYLNGPDSIPQGKELAHSCHRKLCLIHARPKTHLENIQEIPGAPQYDWDSWLNGEEWTLWRGTHYQVGSWSFADTATKMARRQGLRVHMRKYLDAVVLRAEPR